MKESELSLLEGVEGGLDIVGVSKGVAIPFMIVAVSVELVEESPG